MDQITKILSLRASGHVKRWHTLPHFGEQTDAEHSAQALTLLFLLHPDPSVNLIKAMLWHDFAERYAGDVPAPARRENPTFALEYEKAENKFFAEHGLMTEVFNQLDEDDWHWLKAIDTLELLLWCHDQMLLGNSHARIVAKRARGYLQSEVIPAQVKQFAASINENSYRSFA